MFEWEEQDRFSFEDSDRFEEDSLCSWISEPESVVNNWRGWRKQSSITGRNYFSKSLDKDGNVLSLTELAAREVASSIPFESVEQFYPPVPEPLQLRIAYYSFPEQEEDIRLYACLANGSADEFNRGENMYKNKAVREPLQIGFHLSATVSSGTLGKPAHSTSVTFDRKRIVSCQCSCNSSAEWCCHLVALCLHRIHMADGVKLRAPVSESLSRLQRDQLQKFAQYLIYDLPQQILPTAQRLLDELLSSTPSDINTVSGAPDPTAGGSLGEQSNWTLDNKNLRDNIKKILIKFCVPAPIVFSDVNYLSTTAPPSAAEWSSFLRPLRGREPEGMWNLLSIVREMYKRNDRNSIPLLEIVTLQCLETAQIMVWWFNTRVAFQQTGQGKHNVNSNSQASQNACASMCDELVTLWKLAALNPCIAPAERETLKQRLIQYHKTVIEKVQSNQGNSGSKPSNKSGKLSDIEIFSGFKPAIEACFLNWDDYQIPGVTYGHNPKYLCPFTVFKHPAEADSAAGRAGCSQVNSSQAVLRCEYPGVAGHRPRSGHEHRPRSQAEGGRIATLAASEAAARSSLSSEEVPSDEGMEEAPSQSEGEGGPDTASAAFPPKYSSFSNANDTSGNSFKENVEEESKRVTESSPERDMESDWSSGPSEEQRVAEAAEPATPPVLAPPPADPQDYRVYFYDPKVPVTNNNNDGSKDEIDIFKNLRQLEDPWEILFMRAEGIHAHGYQSHACEMAVRLALDMLKNPPDLISDAPPLSLKGKKRRVCAASHQITHTASLTLTHCAFLCTVLSETAHNPHHLNLAFQIGMFGLEMARPPASTKPMEVKLAHQESDLVALLKRLQLGPAELSIVRERALQLKEGTLKSRGEALLPLMLASFIFESLVMPQLPGSSRDTSRYNVYRNAGDELLGFDAATAAIGLKANVSEADHPLLCEGTRRQRGDLALNLLVTYKDDPERLTRIMDKLLDKDIHQMFKSPILPSYYTCRSTDTAVPPTHPPLNPAPAVPAQLEAGMANMNLGARPRDRNRRASREERPEPPVPRRHEAAGGAGVAVPPGSPQPDWDSYKAWEAKFRCANLRVNKPRTPGHHMASIDSSAPETASSDNSPTLVRRFKPPPSDSGSSGNSSDSSGSRRPRAESPGMAAHGFVPPAPPPANVTPRNEPLIANQPPPLPHVSMMEMTNLTRTTLPNIKVTRFKGKRAYPSIPNQPSEASAHFMFELAKTVLTKAGGTSTTSLFTQPTANQNPRGPQRALHMCAFQIGLYALGLHNRVSPNWISRTYSSHVSWITGQAMEIGATAISFLMGTWEGHLTPPEAANIADRASRGRDNQIVSAAADLALSCLNNAHALNPNEIARAILQCKEQSDQMLEKACLAVENAATGGGVYPEVMFEVARHWYDLYKRHAPPGTLPRDDDHSVPPPARPPMVSEGLPMATQPSVTMAQNQNNLSNSISSFPLGHMSQMNAASIAGMQAFPAVYSLIQGYPGLPAPNNLPLHMYVGPPPHHILPVPTSMPGPGAGIAGQFPGIHPNMHGLQMFNNVSEAGPRFNMAGGPLFHLSLPNMPNLPGISMAPLLPNPPHTQHLQQGVALLAHPPPSASPLQPPPPPSPGHHAVNGNALACQRYLMSAYRVGMVALETLGRRVSEDRPQTKFTRNPSYAEDVKWLLGVAKKLGVGCLQNFLMCVMATVVSPFILQDLTWDCGCFLSAVPVSTGGGSAAQHQVNAVIQQIRTQPYLTSLAQKCYQMYYQCIHQRLYHLTPAEYEDFTAIILHARKAFMWTASGQNEFQNLLSSLRRTKSCKKDLWSKITAAVQNASLPGLATQQQ